ncbi:MAG: type II toxin-antitoxin system RelE/ParE family toxin [Spirochaetales bacterium]|nr:type II toxin-antitoxin system RelE/ParE family toxin [Spirochaetales bacterium]
MIQSFNDKETEKVWNQEYSKKLPREIQKAGLRKLIMIHRANDLNDLKVPPGNRLEQLSGDRKGQCSTRINSQWRICFIWTSGNANSVEIVDSH